MSESHVASALRIAKTDGGPVRSLPAPQALNLPEPPTKAHMDKYAYQSAVPLNRARATQTTMDWRDKGERVSPGPLIKGYGDKPVAVKKETGEYLVYDGHHRSVSALNEGKKHLDMHVIDAKMYDPANAGRAPARQGVSDDELLRSLRIAKADGGSIGIDTFAGPIHSEVAGRTDHLPLHVESGAYVLPADVVSSFGEGNTMAAFKVLRRLFGGQPYENTSTPYAGSEGPYNEPLKPTMARGGKTNKVPVVVAGGEYILSPAQVRMVGDGDLDTGHKVLDEFVLRNRKELIKTLKALPGPKKS